MSTEPLSAQDFAEISNLYGAYNLCSDLGDVDGYAECFTSDGVLEVLPQDIRIEGRAALKEHKRRDLAGRNGRYRRHWNGSLNLKRLMDGTIRGRCYLIAYNGDPGTLPSVADCGVYEDTVVKEDGFWRFRHRHLTMDGSTWKRT
ncbi:hypothetical protein FHS85_002450 [Rhodoligotrophos appendicifer]|uniref:nuclear transport factor 2 family protein n=1 Tax=Rhodoligotrophos appendicifer TaxID=987056 RepID=UPI001186E30C|nr:nuclear transport factor 2 family protein [Rhodoligotrophos appendicifer]